MQATSTAYMLIFRETTPERYEGMSREELRVCLDNWNGWCDEVAAGGKLEHGHPLAPEGRIVSGASAKGATDGPFAEAKEMIGGYLLVSVDTLDEAMEIARRCANLEYGMTVEVRPVTGACHLARALGMDTMREAEVG